MIKDGEISCERFVIALIFRSCLPRSRSKTDNGMQGNNARMPAEFDDVKSFARGVQMKILNHGE